MNKNKFIAQRITAYLLRIFGDTGVISKNLYQFFVGMIGAAFFILTLHIFAPVKPTIGTVNVTGIVDKFVKLQTQKIKAMKEEQNLHGDDKLLQEQLTATVKEFGKTLETTMKQISVDKHVVLLPSEAVIAGARDYTGVVEEALLFQQEDKQRETREKGIER